MQRWVKTLLAKREITPDGHWLWTGAVHPKTGHGTFCGKGVHRWAVHEWGDCEGNDVPDDWDVHHKCGVVLCFNPEHLKSMSKEEHRAIHRIH